MPKISPMLWFDNQAEEAASFYVGIFPNSRIVRIGRRPEGAPGVTGDVMTVEFELDGQRLVALNGGPMFKFSEAVSMVINCATQAEIDHYWNALIADGGQESMCGWLKDRFGFSWQVTPALIGDVIGGSDTAKTNRVMAKVMKMRKLDLAVLEAAAKG